jgi:tRNA-specific 2-thiouridylase
METEFERVSALAMLSGGLDSQLAICVVREQGVHVEAVFFESPFHDAGRARQAAAAMGIQLHVIDYTGDIVNLLERPKHGFGACMNPCIDCHAMMLRRTGELARELGYQFIFTGEVLDQRPMSQRRRGLDIVAEDSGFEELIVRPLSAGNLPPSMPERRGWLDRSRLLSLCGRSRKPQFELAEKYELKDYPTPAGGCRLTEPNFCRRLRDLKDHEGLRGVTALERLRVGRHLRLHDSVKIIVGRNERDNALLEGGAELYDLVLKVEEIPGPTVLIPFTAPEEYIQMAATIAARYSDSGPDDLVTLRLRSPRGSRHITVTPADPEAVAKYMI